MYLATKIHHGMQNGKEQRNESPTTTRNNQHLDHIELGDGIRSDHRLGRPSGRDRSRRATLLLGSIG